MGDDDVIIHIDLRKISYIVLIIGVIAVVVYYDRVRDKRVYNNHVREIGRLGFELHDEFSWWLYKSGHPTSFNEYFDLNWGEFRDLCLDFQVEGLSDVYLDDTINKMWFRISIDDYSGEVYTYDSRRNEN